MKFYLFDFFGRSKRLHIFNQLPFLVIRQVWSRLVAAVGVAGLDCTGGSQYLEFIETFRGNETNIDRVKFSTSNPKPDDPLFRLLQQFPQAWHGAVV